MAVSVTPRCPKICGDCLSSGVRLPVYAARPGSAKIVAMAAITVLVIDDHSGFRSCARHLLEREGYRVIGEAGDGESGVACAEELRPELALVDVYLPGIDGFEVAARLADLEAAPQVVLISSRTRAELEPLVTDSRARGFIPKDELSREAIEEVL